MEALECILTRRSIRSYSTQALSEETIEKLLRAAVAAPSAGNEQPWHFVVIRNPETLKAIPNSVHPYAEMAAFAQAAIVICGDESQQKHQGFWVQDCSAATENVLLAAHALGLGAVWVGLYPKLDRAGAIRALLQIPDHIIPLSLIPLGYPGETKEASNRYNPERIHLEKW